MLFPSVELAGRIERSEAQLISASAAEVLRKRGPSTGGFCMSIGGGVAAYSDKGLPLNKVAGVGFAGVPEEGEWAEVERRYAERGCPVQVELSNLADPAIGKMLTRRGYELVGYENVLGIELASGIAEVGSGTSDSNVAVSASALNAARAAEKGSSAKSGTGEAIIVEACEPARLREWIDVVITGFETPDVEGVASHEHFDRGDMERVYQDMSGTAGLVNYMALRGGEAAGGGSMFYGIGVAHLCGAATLPRHRRRGVQSALLAHRLRDAARRGFDLAVVVTQPGSKSQENVMKRGFGLLYTRGVLVKGSGNAVGAENGQVR